MLVLQNLDGPYVAFVGSVKLEGAYLAISQRDVEAEAEEARLGQIQEDVRKEEEEEEQQEFLDSVEGESEKSAKHGKEEEDLEAYLPLESVQLEEQQGSGKKLSQLEDGESASMV